MQRVQIQEFYVPAGVAKGNVVMPQMFMSDVLLVQRAGDGEGKKYLRACEYGFWSRPTLAELTHGFFGKYLNGKFISRGLRENILEARDAEWLATYAIKEGRKNRIISNPASVYQAKSGRWKTKGGEDVLVSYVPEGWPIARDTRTGWPLEISEEKEQATGVYGNDASYFVPNTADGQLSAVLRLFDFLDSGPFCVGAYCVPDYRSSDIGGRACRRLEQDAKHLATPLQIAA